MKTKIKFTDQPQVFDPRDNCYIRALRRYHDVEFSDKPDFVFYGAFGTDFLNYPDSVLIFLADEPVLPNFNDCDYSIGTADLSFGERYFHHPPITEYCGGRFWERFSPPRNLDNNFDRPFCNFIYSNVTNGYGARLRVEFCKKLAEYRPVDCLGTVLHNKDGGIEPRYHKSQGRLGRTVNPGWAEAKLDCLSGYKFTIAFENTALSGWTTEKLIDPLAAHSIPIYWGNPHVSEYFNAKAFINCEDYGNDLDEVVRAVIELDQDRERYMEMLREPPLLETFPFHWEDDLADFLDGVVRRGVRPFDKNPIGFPSMSAQNLGILSRSGKIGLRTIAAATADALSGWIQFKWKRR